MVIPPTLTAEEVNAIVDETHKKGSKVFCHAFGGEGLRNCIDAGVDSIEHGVELEEMEDIASPKSPNAAFQRLWRPGLRLRSGRA